MSDFRPHRRIVFQGLGALGVAAALAGCGGGDGGSATPDSGSALASTSEVPVGGGIVLGAANVVITQPTAGTFRAFTATCTHQGSTLARVAEDGIECDLHGSRFAVDDGSAIGGPATETLAEVAITIDGDQILAA